MASFYLFRLKISQKKIDFPRLEQPEIFTNTFFQIIAVFQSLNEKNLDLTLKAFYYLSIQLYITSAFYSSMNNTRGLRRLFAMLEKNMAERK